jgi:hypothetical protein
MLNILALVYRWGKVCRYSLLYFNFIWLKSTGTICIDGWMDGCISGQVMSRIAGLMSLDSVKMNVIC